MSYAQYKTVIAGTNRARRAAGKKPVAILTEAEYRRRQEALKNAA